MDGSLLTLLQLQPSYPHGHGDCKEVPTCSHSQQTGLRPNWSKWALFLLRKLKSFGVRGPPVRTVWNILWKSLLGISITGEAVRRSPLCPWLPPWTQQGRWDTSVVPALPALTGHFKALSSSFSVRRDGTAGLLSTTMCCFTGFRYSFSYISQSGVQVPSGVSLSLSV